jgi:hypothetical protein
VKKIFKSIFTSPLILVNALKKTKIDNFVGGLIFGAIFSLLVNVVTVKLQEDINKQRYLEALEREIIFHTLTVNNINNEVNRVVNLDNNDYITADGLLRLRYNTRVWDSDYLQPYIFELKPDVGAKINAYYETIIRNANLQMDKNIDNYEKIYARCSPFRILIEEKESEEKDFCNEIVKNTALLQKEAAFSNLVVEYVTDIRNNFHPTQNRLNSWWLRLLLGGESFKIMEFN